MKFKKIFLGILATLSIFTFIGCKKSQNEKETIEKIRQDILKSERFNINDFKSAQKKSYIKKVSANEFLTSDKDLYNDNELLYEFDNENKKHIFRNIINRKQFDFDSEKFTIANYVAANYILLYDKDNKYYFVSKLDGKILLEIKDATLSSNPDKNKITQKNKISTYNRQFVDFVKSHNESTHDVKYYYFHNFELVKDVEKFKKDIFETEKKGLNVRFNTSNATISVDGKFYDFINFNSQISGYHVLENNNIIFKSAKRLMANFNINKNNNDIKNYYIERDGNAYLYHTYLYDFKNKQLKEINLPFMIEDVFKNEKDSEGKLTFSNSKIKNLVSIKMIDPETRQLATADLVVADNYFKNIIKVTTRTPYEMNKVAENRYLVREEANYSLIDKKGNVIRNFPDKNVVAVHNQYLVVNNSGKPINNTNYKVDIYDLLEGKYIAKNYYLAKSLTGIELEKNVFYNENYEPVLLVNNSKNPFVKVKGKIWSHKNLPLYSFTDGTNLYLYHRTGQLIAEIPDLNKFKTYYLNYSTFSNPSDPYSDYTNYTLIKYTSSDNKHHYIIFKQEVSYKLEK